MKPGSHSQEQGIYLDANASLPLHPKVKEALLEAMDLQGNPSSIHRFGRDVRARLEKARNGVAAFFDVSPAQVIFTSSGTEANHLALRQYRDQVILVSAGEHLSLLEAHPSVFQIPLTSEGSLHLEAGKRLIEEVNPSLISVTYANNETGILNPLEEVVSLASSRQIRVHTDAVQALGKVPLRFKDLGVDFLSVSAHKVGGPQGIGALIVAEDAPLKALFRGGGQERRRRAGTENSLGIIGFAAALDAFSFQDWEATRTLRDTLEEEIGKIHPPACVIPQHVPRLPHTSSLRMTGVESQKQVMNFDLRQIAVSTGSACSSGKVTPSHVLQAMGVDPTDVIRVSLPPTTTRNHILSFIQTWHHIYTDLSRKDSA